MAYVYFNNNPRGKHVGDCVIRALSIVTDESWDDTFWALCNLGFNEADMPSSNAIWSKYLRQLGQGRKALPDDCPDCYTVRDFCEQYRRGKYILATGSHAVAVINGNYYDAWDSGDEVPQYYFYERGSDGL